MPVQNSDSKLEDNYKKKLEALEKRLQFVENQERIHALDISLLKNKISTLETEKVDREPKSDSHKTSSTEEVIKLPHIRQRPQSGKVQMQREFLNCPTSTPNRRIRVTRIPTSTPSKKK